MINTGLLNQAAVTQYPTGSVICREGEADGRLYIVVKGSVITYKRYGAGQEKRISTLEPGSFLGEMGLFLGRSQPVTAVAGADAEVIVLNRSQARTYFSNCPDAAFALMEALCQKNERTHMAYRQLYAVPRDKEKKTQPSASVAPVKPAEKKAPPIASVPKAKEKAPSSLKEAPPQRDFPSDEHNVDALFPQGHGNYTLPLLDPESELGKKYLYHKNHTCPQCGAKFTALTVKSSKLINKTTEADGRVRYQDGVEPVYYDAFSCPHCGYSGLADAFAGVLKRPDIVKGILAPYRTGTRQTGGFLPQSARDIFASYYMGILCAPVCQVKSDLPLARLWFKLSRIYADCGDAYLESHCAQKALAFYHKAYLSSDFPPRQLQQLYCVMGELYLKEKDYKNARNFFFKAKTQQGGVVTVRRQAEDRLDALRELIGE